MSNTLVIQIYIPFAIITAVITAIEVKRRFKRQEDYLFMLLCLFAVCWFAIQITGIVTDSEKLAKYCSYLMLIFVGLIPPVLLLFVMKFYKVSYWPSKRFMILMFTIPAVNTVMALTGPLHTWVKTELTIVSLAPVREVINVWGPWFWIHTAYCYLIAMILIVVILFRHFRMPPFYRFPSSLMVIGVSITLFGNMLYLLDIFPFALDPTLLTIGLSLILFHLAIISNNKSKFVRLSHGQIYHYLDVYILIADEKRRIVDSNRTALEYFTSEGIELTSVTLEELIEALIGREGAWQKASEDEKGIDLHFNGGAFPVVLNLCVHDITDLKGDTLGSLAVFTDVTHNRLLIERLEAKAGMDPLTGLANRMAYEGAKQRLNAPEHLPLSVIMCDVNDLKYTNDTLGHLYGDRMLQVFSSALEDVCSKEDFIARIGGDEFVILLPNRSPESATWLMKQIREKLLGLEGLPFHITVAMGTATKATHEESMEEIIAIADDKMYANKNKMKQGARAG